MNLQQLFTYEGNELRTISRNGEPWFVLKDVCEVLEIGNPSQVKARLDGGVISNEVIPDALGRMQDTTIINEDGLYDVILESRKPEARAFRKWITSEVVPSIRKTGSYQQHPPKTQAELSLLMAESLVQHEHRMKELEQRLYIANERINNIDKVNPTGDEQQRFNKMIRLFATKHGMTFQKAYREFKGAYNIAYRTNITMLHENYKMKHGNCTLPEFLVATGHIEDAIRVADKMLNQGVSA